MPFPGYAIPEQYLIDVGVITIDGKVTAWGATVGGLRFNPGVEIRHVQFDGLRSEIQGQHRNTGGSAVISGKVLSSSDANIIRMNPGSTSDGSDLNTITLLQNDVFWAEGDYLDDVYYIGRRQDNKVFMVHMDKAYVRRAELTTTDKSESGWDIELVPVLEDSTENPLTNISLMPYVYEVEA